MNGFWPWKFLGEFFGTILSAALIIILIFLFSQLLKKSQNILVLFGQFLHLKF